MLGRYFFHRSRYGRVYAAAGPGRAHQNHRRRRCGGHRRDLPRCRWAAASPGRAHQNHRHRRCGGRRRDRRARAGFEATRRAKLAARTARGRAAAHRHTQRPGPPAPGTPAGPQTQTQTEAQTQQSGPEPLGSGPPLMLSADQRTTRVSSARPPCRPCRSSRRRTSPHRRAYSRNRGSRRNRSSRRRNARGHRASRRSR